jgi:hypothetical protein
MLAHGATDAKAARIFRDDEARIRNMRAKSRPVRPQDITADNMLVAP